MTHKSAWVHLRPRLCGSLLLRLENPCCNACFPILLLDIFINMPMSQNRSNCAFRFGFLRLTTDSTAQSGLNGWRFTYKPECPTRLNVLHLRTPAQCNTTVYVCLPKAILLYQLDLLLLTYNKYSFLPHKLLQIKITVHRLRLHNLSSNFLHVA